MTIQLLQDEVKNAIVKFGRRLGLVDLHTRQPEQQQGI